MISARAYDAIASIRIDGDKQRLDCRAVDADLRDR